MAYPFCVLQNLKLALYLTLPDGEVSDFIRRRGQI